jgi:hypothetical protein
MKQGEDNVADQADLFGDDKLKRPKTGLLISDHVGKSDRRTPVKHAMLRNHSGRDVGAAMYAARKLNLIYGGHCFIDLTAGDAHGDGINEWERASSPGIFSIHARNLPNVRGKLYEKSFTVFESLIINLDYQLPFSGFEKISDLMWRHTVTKSTIEAIHGDARDVVFDDLGDREWLYVFNDPNQMHGWCLNVEQFVAIKTRNRCITFMSTMGCNSGGLKRLELNERLSWSDHVKGLMTIIERCSWLDLVLFEIVGDAAQWAYLLLVPSAWIEKTIAETMRQSERDGVQMNGCSHKSDPRQFNVSLNRLFLSKSERERGHFIDQAGNLQDPSRS